jgi:hypothetical protein
MFISLSTLAWADHGTPGPQETRKTEERYQPRNQLVDVRLEAGRGRTRIDLPRTGRPIDYLELRAGRTAVTLDDVVIHFADGTSMQNGDRGLIEPFEGRVIDLPRGSSAAIAITARYRTATWRIPARLQVFGVNEHNYSDRRYDDRRPYGDRRYDERRPNGDRRWTR